MSKLSRKISRNNNKLESKLFMKLTKPDNECNNCACTTKDCFMKCKLLHARNAMRNKELINKYNLINGINNTRTK